MKSPIQNTIGKNFSSTLNEENDNSQGEAGKMLQEIKNELRTNPIYQDFFKNYNPLSVEAFIENYAIKKARYIGYGEMINKCYENAFLRRQIEAEERLWEIQRKKLFDLECQWRAEVIKIPEIEVTVDFEYWEKNIENCLFIPPITEDEFEMYRDYLLSEDFYDFKMEWKWMGYKEIKENHKEYGTLPSWYEYYDLRKGTGSFLVLPDIRGDKEEYYINIWRNNNSSKPKTKRVIDPDPRPFLKSYDLSIIEEFIKKYEDHKTLEYFKIYEGELHKSNDEVEQALRVLREADEVVPMENNYDWKLAIIQTAKKFEQKKLSEALEAVFKKYSYRLKIGIAQETLSSESNIMWIKNWSNEIKQKIIKARVLNNEPADLNF
ncbi:MAG: hypothetical protein NTX22_11200 [Ignavibacteriales bacterium]|nr:hypothetical protein [Ignavibacteriales bacterium]